MKVTIRRIFSTATVLCASTLSLYTYAQRDSLHVSNIYRSLVLTCDSARHDEHKMYYYAHKAVILANMLTSDDNNYVNPDSVAYYKSEGLYYIGRYYMNVGNSTANKQYYQIASNYIQNVISIRKGLKNAKDMTGLYNYWAYSLELSDKLDSAIIIYKKNIDACMKDGDVHTMAIAHHLLGRIYLKQGKYADSETSLLNALGIRQLTGDQKYIAKTYVDLGDLYLSTGEIDKAYSNIDKAIKIAPDDRAIDVLLKVIRASYKSAIEHNDKDGALKYLEREVAIRDSIKDKERYSEEYNNEMMHLIQLKESQIEALEMQNKIDSENIQQYNENSEKTTFGIIILHIFIFVSIWFAIYYLIQYRKKKRYIYKLEANNIVINKQKEELAIQRDKLETIQDAVTDSVRYASKIQLKVMTGAKDVNTIFPFSFVLYKPKEIVSGDFYYIKQIGDYKIAAVADCTGHGTPAALLSILCIGFLNEELTNLPIPHANEILETLRTRIKYTLNTQDADDTVLDGCDMGIIIFNEKEHKLEFAGANIDLFVSRQSCKDLEIDVLRGTKNPLGWYLKEQPFKCYEITINNDDTIYLMSDGYKDQLGKDGTFGGIRIKKLLNKIAKLPINEQRREVQSTFSAWMDTYEQVDDVTVLGIKFHNKGL